MDARVGLSFLLVLGASWVGDGRNLANTYSASERVHQNEYLCTMCENYVNKTLYYLKENKTQTEIIETLHSSCFQIPYYDQECILLVDYYAPLFFSTVAEMEPDKFCQKVNLCEKLATISEVVQEESCEMCHQVIAELLQKLNDPDTQIEITQLLLKACDSVEKHVKKCKKLVLIYVPQILSNADKFLEKTDMCAVIHACDSSMVERKQASSSSSPIVEMPLLSES